MVFKKKTSQLCLYKISVFFTLAFGCSSESSPSNSLVTEQISGRDSGLLTDRPPLYQVKIPHQWTTISPLLTESIMDTTKPLKEFLIQENGEKIRLTIHNFPSENRESRIPPTAQIARWKQQLSPLDPTSVVILAQSFSGFVGLLFEGNGFINNEPSSILGWSLQLDPIHYRTLSHPTYHPQLRADVTIKATGPKNLMAKHYSAIYAFAQSFELIEEIPPGL